MMDIPTSQAPTNQTGLSLDACLSQLAAGTFAYSQLATFSDLSRDKMKRLSATWLTIDPAIRRRVIGEAVDLAEASVDYQFNRLFRHALTDPEAPIRQVAIAGLWEDDSRSLLSDMRVLVTDDPSDDVRAAAVAFLGDTLVRLREIDEEPDSLDEIAELIMSVAGDESVSAIIRRRAVEAVGALAQTDATRHLIQEAFDYGDPALEAGALLAMGRSLESRWRPIALGSIESDDPELRYEAARALGLLGSADDVEEITALTIDDDTDVRRAAIEALGEIGGPGAVRILRKLAESADDTGAEIIEEALDNALLASDPLRSDA